MRIVLSTIYLNYIFIYILIFYSFSKFIFITVITKINNKNGIGAVKK